MNKPFFTIILAAFLTVSSLTAYAQDEPCPIPPFPAIAQTSPDGSRFELLVTNRDDVRVVFRVDKCTGDVWELTTGFRPLKLIKYLREADPNDLAEDGRINYQLVAFSSSTLYLINLNTGVMWEKTPDDLFRKNASFQLLKEQ